MAPGTPDPERHRPEGMDMAGRVEGVRPVWADCREWQDAYSDLKVKVDRYEKALRRIAAYEGIGPVSHDGPVEFAKEALGA